jgi:hypothetical protein
MIIPAVPAQGLNRELLDAFARVEAARQEQAAALAHYDQVHAAVQAHDREKAHGR